MSRLAAEGNPWDVHPCAIASGKRGRQEFSPLCICLPLMVMQKQIPGFELIWPGCLNPLAHFSWIFSLIIVKHTASGMLSSMPNATDLTLQQILFWQYPPAALGVLGRDGFLLLKTALSHLCSSSNTSPLGKITAAAFLLPTERDIKEKWVIPCFFPKTLFSGCA